MSKIITRDHMPPRPPRPPKGKDAVTLDEAADLTMRAAGPLAVVLDEAMGKIARLEDALGIDDETVLRASYRKLAGWRRWIMRLVMPKLIVPALKPDILRRQREADGGDLE